MVEMARWFVKTMPPATTRPESVFASRDSFTMTVPASPARKVAMQITLSVHPFVTVTVLVFANPATTAPAATVSFLYRSKYQY